MLDINDAINSELRKRNVKERAEHTRSGKLSAGKLYDPTLDQVLYILGVPTKENDDYSLRLFSRGNQVEEWVVDKLPPGETQKEVHYRDVIGLVDYIDKNKDVYEVKSIKASKYKWIRSGGAMDGHKWQACLYALATKREAFSVVYAVADDYRIIQHRYNTKDYKDAVDASINAVERSFEVGLLPDWEPRTKWQENPNYSKYPEWIGLSSYEAMEKLRKEYPKIYKKFTGGK